MNAHDPDCVCVRCLRDALAESRAVIRDLASLLIEGRFTTMRDAVYGLDGPAVKGSGGAEDVPEQERVSSSRPVSTTPDHSTVSASMNQGVPEVRIVAEDKGGPGWSVYDGQEWFAHSSTITGALHYAGDLLHGPGVGPRGSVWNLMRAIEETGYNPTGDATFEERMEIRELLLDEQ